MHLFIISRILARITTRVVKRTGPASLEKIVIGGIFGHSRSGNKLLGLRNANRKMFVGFARRLIVAQLSSNAIV